ncbi:SCO2523 family variant P-loop protein [Cryptosporangium phraense]|uniref:ParA family protein n=1 Tax=Cryptosporangium phraense TaxID=2593070 RepID=A0A545AW36_9ACTN|nr:SCO2523 family variant P-loop protein [Cryptosporangium phraense]TQS45533.1 ParA family protein [Cryptosporangium phraense]
MIVFATSDKGGTGRSVTVSNVAYRRALHGDDVCYLDFDFGSPTSGAIFHINEAARGIPKVHGARNGRGLHSYVQGEISDPVRLDVWRTTDRSEMRDNPTSGGRLVLLPGDQGGGELPRVAGDVKQVARLFRTLDEEFGLCLVDLSAGRSYATDLVLEAVRSPLLKGVESRWLVFHRWTKQHIIAASGLVFGENGILASAGRNPEPLVRFVRTAVVDPDSSQLSGLRPAQVAWLRRCNRELQELAGKHGLGHTMMLGEIPLEPMLQWREQLLLDDDVYARQVANLDTLEAFESLADRLFDRKCWEML